MMLAVSLEDAERIEAALKDRMAILRKAGFDDEDEVKAYQFLLHYVSTSIRTERMWEPPKARDRAEADP